MRAQIQEWELELMSPPARADAARLRELLHPEFVEIGRSGRRWTREPIIESLLTHPRDHTPVVDEWEFTDITEGLLLVTYRSPTARTTASGSAATHHSGTQPAQQP
jgi:ribonuclease HI